MRDYKTPLPDDLALPHPGRERVSAWAGIIVGGVMLISTTGLLIYALSISL